jgi:UDP-2,3-diacylglucosamine pyrophosphatase LpxH
LRQNFCGNVQKKFVIYVRKVKKEYEYLIVSDLHLTSLVAQTEKFEHVIKNYHAKNVVLNGDIIDVNHTQKLKKHDWKILKQLSKLTQHSECYWNAGNHDADVSGILSEFIGYKHALEHIAEINNKKICITHGDKFDSFIGDYPIITNIATGLYYWLQAIDPKEQRIPRYFKKRSKNWIKAAERVRKNAMIYAENNGYSQIICSHTHHSENVSENVGVNYTNTGCFTYKECNFATIDNLGSVVIHTV